MPYRQGLKRVVRVVALLWPGKSGMTLELLFSTDLTMDAATIVRLYRARFAMEFPFRDGKRPSVLMGAVLAKTQFAGLNDCQSRQAEALHFHWNMALHSVSIARASQLISQRASVVIGAALPKQRASPLVFSMEDEKHRAYNEFFAHRILSMLPGGLTCEEFPPEIADLLLLGVKAA